MNSSINKYEDVVMTDISYMNPEKIGPSYYSPIGYGDTNDPLYIQTPKIKCLHSISDVKEKTNPFLEVEIPNGKYDIYEFFMNMDDHNIKTTYKNRLEWFSKDLPLEAVDDMYKRTVQPFKKNSNPKLKFRLPVIKGKIMCNVYNQQKVFVDLDEIKEDSEVILILHIRGLKILKQYFYCDCYVSQIKLFQPENIKYSILPEYCMVDDDEKDIYDDIFDEEIYKASDDYKKKIDEKKKEEEQKRKEEEERIEEEKRKEEEKIKKIDQIRMEIEQKKKELELLDSQ